MAEKHSLGSSIMSHRVESCDLSNLPEWKRDFIMKKRALVLHQNEQEMKRDASTSGFGSKNHDEDVDDQQEDDSDVSSDENGPVHSGGYSVLTGQRIKGNESEPESTDSLEDSSDSGVKENTQLPSESDTDGSVDLPYQPGFVSKLLNRWSSISTSSNRSSSITRRVSREEQFEAINTLMDSDKLPNRPIDTPDAVNIQGKDPPKPINAGIDGTTKPVAAYTSMRSVVDASIKRASYRNPEEILIIEKQTDGIEAMRTRGSVSFTTKENLSNVHLKSASSFEAVSQAESDALSTQNPSQTRSAFEPIKISQPVAPQRRKKVDSLAKKVNESNQTTGILPASKDSGLQTKASNNLSQISSIQKTDIKMIEIMPASKDSGPNATASTRQSQEPSLQNNFQSKPKRNSVISESSSKSEPEFIAVRLKPTNHKFYDLEDKSNCGDNSQQIENISSSVLFKGKVNEDISTSDATSNKILQNDVVASETKIVDSTVGKGSPSLQLKSTSQPTSEKIQFSSKVSSVAEKSTMSPKSQLKNSDQQTIAYAKTYQDLNNGGFVTGKNNTSSDLRIKNQENSQDSTGVDSTAGKSNTSPDLQIKNQENSQDSNKVDSAIGKGNTSPSIHIKSSGKIVSAPSQLNGFSSNAKPEKLVTKSNIEENNLDKKDLGSNANQVNGHKPDPPQTSVNSKTIAYNSTNTGKYLNGVSKSSISDQKGTVATQNVTMVTNKTSVWESNRIQDGKTPDVSVVKVNVEPTVVASNSDAPKVDLEINGEKPATVPIKQEVKVNCLPSSSQRHELTTPTKKEAKPIGKTPNSPSQVAKSVHDIPSPVKLRKDNPAENQLQSMLEKRRSGNADSPVTNIDDLLSGRRNTGSSVVFDTRKSMGNKRKIPEYEKIREGPVVQFQDTQVLVGKGCLKGSQSNQSMKKNLSFNDAKSVHEYPSEKLMIQECPKEPGAVYFDDPDHLQAAPDRSIDDPEEVEKSNALINGKPSIKSESLSSRLSNHSTEYSFGQTVVFSVTPSETREENSESTADIIAVKPASEADVKSFSSSGSSDLLF